MMSVAQDIVAFLADIVTVVAGCAAAYGMIRHGKKVRAFVRLLSYSVVGERVKRIKGTLGKLENSSFDVKEDRKDILALLGELAGMLKSFSNRQPDFRQTYEEIVTKISNPSTLTESTKRRICAEVHGLLDDRSLAAVMDLLEEHHE